MPTDYGQIREENIRRYGTETAHLALLGDLYSDRTHFIFELLQNAEDAKATAVQFRILDSGLELSHDGRPFNPDDVRGISSICQSTNRGDPERIGRFGIGFKAVYAYTRAPEIHSGDEHFCIENYVRPKKAQERAPGAGFTTLIALPFDTATMSPAVAKREITRAFQRLDPTTLLFLRHVNRVELSAGEGPAVILEKRPTDQLSPWVRFLELGCSTNGEAHEKWLLFERPITLSTPAGNDVQCRVELAFELTPSSSKEAFEIVARERAVLAVFFPTEWKTATGFILQGPYMPTPARDNIRQNDPTNMLLAKETAALVVDSLCWLRQRGVLTPGVLNTLPIKRSDFPADTLLRPLFDHVLEAILGQPLLPAYAAASKPQDFVEGGKAVAASSASLRDLLGDSLLPELAGDQSCKWLADGVTVKGNSDLAKYLREEVKVREISAHDFVVWLGTKDASWWKGLDESWLARCCRYLHTQTAEHAAVKKLPVVRQESGEHVVPADQPVFFPAENAHEKEELALFLTELPVVSQGLLNDDKDKTVESFLRQMGVAPLVAFQFIQKYLVPRYASPKVVTIEENRSHIRFLRSAFSRMSPDELKNAISELQNVKVLICHKASDPKLNDLVAPTNAYLPAAYTNDDKLERFFKASPGTWFVDPGYISDGENPKVWSSFLIQLGTAALPRVVVVDEWNCRNRAVDGLKAALNAIANEPTETRVLLASAVWSMACQILPDGDRYRDFRREQFLQATQEIYGPRGGYHGSRQIDASFFVDLRDTAWLPDTTGAPQKPGLLFEDSKYNRELLADAVIYLHRDVQIKTAEEEWLASRLGISRAPTKEGVLARLRFLKVAEVTDAPPQPLYEFLDRNRADVREVFEEQSLVLCPGDNRKWIKPSQSFWEDESGIFGATRGYLKKFYPKLQEFFTRIGVAASAGPIDYARALMEIAAAESIDEATRTRVHRICKRLADRLEDGGDWQDEDWRAVWKQLQQGVHWIGKCADKYAFKAPKQLFRMDNDHLAALFAGRLSFWSFLDLNDFASEQLRILGCSSATCRFTPVEPGGADERLSEQLKKHWPLIRAFLHSDKWKSAVRDDADAALARRPTIKLTTRIAVTYELAGVTVEEPEGKSSFFDGESGTLWLAKGSDEDDAAEAMGDALQEFFGPEVLREFVCDLFRKASGKALEKWRKKGLILTAPIESPTEEPKPPPADEVEPVHFEVEQPEGSVAGAVPADSSGAGSPSDPEPTRQPQPTSGRDGEASGAYGYEPVKTTVSGDGRPLKDDPKTGPASPAGARGEGMGDEEEKKDHGASEGGKESASTGGAGDVRQALTDAFNKSGMTEITDDRPQSDGVRNPADRRKRTRENYSSRKSHEPAAAQRTTQRTVDIWDAKNKVVRDFLYEEYSGRCQICGETNRFPRRDGKAYFEAVYLIPHSEAAWTDEPGSVICLCALCSAKFQHGAVECQNIAQQIDAQKTAEEGGHGQPSISVSLIGKPVIIKFSERHLIEVQELLGVAAGGAGTAAAEAVEAGTGPQHGAKPVPASSPAPAVERISHELVRCPHCPPKAGLIRTDRLQKHIAKVHRKSPIRSIPFHSTAEPGKNYATLLRRVKEGSSLIRCRACGNPAVPGDDYCYTHL